MSSIRERLADTIWPEGAERRNNLERLANTDSLTGLPNRLALTMALSQAEADEGQDIVVVDLDGFKALNDSQGHEAGDVCLQGWAKWMQMICLDKPLRVFRQGGDEFVILSSRDWTNWILAKVSLNRFFHTSGMTVSASVASGDTFAEADKRMLQKKAQKGVLR